MFIVDSPFITSNTAPTDRGIAGMRPCQIR